ncbi:sulfatase-like hydrolase/transferase [Nonomuraea sp. NPDC050394]|uniref:sulfatase-like hydrolase/transferase n=1 Tax=Nonomuraea sp. NPDC050394 TaxID=3364363 RepID=UPI00379B73D9
MSGTYGPSRRAILGGGAALAAMAAAGGGGGTASAPGRAGRPPNIVLILLDDVGHGDWSSYGSREISTPRIDGAGREGMTFSQMYSASPVCTPARAALLTGRYPQRVGLPWVPGPGSRDGMPGYENTAGDVLRAAGYRTGLFGKWHLGDPAARPGLHPEDHGFDTFFGTPEFNKERPFPLYDGRRIIDLLDQEEQVHLSRRCTDRAIDFIRRGGDRPFFLFLPYNPAHEPYHVEERFRGSSKAGPYGDLVQQADFHIGRVLDEIEARGLARDTLVMITSDNGPKVHGTGGLRGGKGWTYEGGIRVPFVARWPGRIRPRSTCERAACFTDVLPTLAAAANGELARDRPIDGVDLTPALLGRPMRVRTLYHYHHWTLSAVRSGPWKLHLPGRENGLWEGDDIGQVEPVEDRGKPLLYHIDTDAGERHNLAGRYPHKVRELTRLAGRFDAEIQARKNEALERAAG